MAGPHSLALIPPSPVVWPPDDTEETVLGTDLHQMTITNLRLGINEAAVLSTLPNSTVPWQAGGQTMYLGFRRPDGSRYVALPDIFISSGPFDILRKSHAIEIDGPPLLIIEVLSDTTYEADLDLDEGKGYSYAQAGVQEYLLLDPIGRYLPERGQGWQLNGGIYHQWRPDRARHWQSRQIPLAFGLEGLHAVVFTSTRRMLREGEIEQERLRLLTDLWQKDAELARKDMQRLQELAQKDAELAQRDRQHRAELERLQREYGQELAELRRRLDAPTGGQVE